MATIQELEEKIKSQKRELTLKDEALRRRSIAVDAMYWVWCDGGCYGGVNRHELVSPLTEEIVQAAENNTRRLRRWYDNKIFRVKMKELSDQHQGVHSLTLWYLAHMERGTFFTIMAEQHHPKDREKIEEAKALYFATKVKDNPGPLFKNPTVSNVACAVAPVEYRDMPKKTIWQVIKNYIGGERVKS
jgi:hypothetical protein